MRRLKLLALQVVVAALLLEIVLRIYNPMPFRVRGDRIVLPVKRSYTFDNGAARKLEPVTHHTKNALGFRGPDPPRDLARRPSLVTIGGSTTECLFLSDGKTWTDVMARALARRWPDIWVNNAGLDGQSSHGHIVLVRDFIAELKPNVAVFLVGTNDVGLDASNGYDSALRPAPTVANRAVQFAFNHSEVLALAQNLARARHARQLGFAHSEIDVAALNDLLLDEGVIAGVEKQYAAYLPAYADRLRQIIALCRKHGIDPVFVTQPALFGDVIDPTTGVDLSRRQVNGRGNGRLEWALLEMYNDVTRKVAAEDRVFLVDLAHTLPKDSRLFYDFLHFTDQGAQAVGSILAAALEPHLREVFQQPRP